MTEQGEVETAGCGGFLVSRTGKRQAFVSFGSLEKGGEISLIVSWDHVVASKP